MPERVENTEGGPNYILPTLMLLKQAKEEEKRHNYTYLFLAPSIAWSSIYNGVGLDFALI